MTLHSRSISEARVARSPLNTFTLPAVLDELARSRAKHTAIVCGGSCYTYKTLRERVVKLANAFEAKGIGSGDRILWLGQNSHRILESLLAAARLGAMLCPVNWRQSGAEFAFVIDDLQPSIIFWQDEEIGFAIAEARAQATWTDALWLQHDGADEYGALLESGSTDDGERDVDPDQPVLVVYTAAFFGTPNGAMLSQTAILTQNLSVQMTQGISPDTVLLNSGPMFHVGQLMSTMATFHAGAINVFARRTEAEELCRLIHEHRCTMAFLVGKSCADMAAVNHDGRFDLKCLNSPSYLPAFDAMVTINPRDYRDTPYGYGQTEVFGLLTWVFYGGGTQKGAHGSVGPLAQVRIVDADDKDVPDGETGEILMRGPTVMNGYWNRPELNAQRQRGGWHHSNDLGRREDDGSITFIGPKTQMIKSGAENIYPAEVEGCLKKHPAVADAAIIGVPDPRFIQSVKAIVVLKDGESADADALIEHCRAHMASYKKPRFFEFTDRLPRTQVGAMDYATLDATYGGGGYPGGHQRGS
jgi:acyl-CoA synthetase (AMP-forming)/AMP-acid ligase II